MTLTIVVADNLVIVDGVAKTVPLPDMGEIRAVQWDGFRGWEEVAGTGENIGVADVRGYQPIIDLFGNTL